MSSLAFFPQPGGPAGLTVGLAGTGGSTTVTLRVRRRDLDAADAGRLLDRLVAALIDGA